jgi:hypothetical protein
MMEMIQRDDRDILDGMLVAVNANDRLNFSMQHNVIPVATAKNMGLIAMKVFADGAMYTKEANWSRSPDHVVRTVGSDALPSRRLVEYTLTTPGIHTLIIGTGQIDIDPKRCQLEQNLSAAQAAPNALPVSDRRAVEKMASSVKDDRTNYFQLSKQPLTPARDPLAKREMRDRKRLVRLEWHTAFAGDEPLSRYEIWRDHQKIGLITHHPQISQKPFVFEDLVADKNAHNYQITTVDAARRAASTENLAVSTAG